MAVFTALGAFVLGLLGFAGSLASAGVSSASAAKQRELTREQNALQRSHEAQLAKLERLQELYLKTNEKQIMVDDLRAAGLNPALAGGYNAISTSYDASANPDTSSLSSNSAFKASNQLPIAALLASGLYNLVDAKRFVYSLTRMSAKDAIRTLDDMYSKARTSAKTF